MQVTNTWQNEDGSLYHSPLGNNSILGHLFAVLCSKMNEKLTKNSCSKEEIQLRNHFE